MTETTVLRDLKEYKVRLDLQVLMVLMVLTETMVLRARKVTRDHKDL